jgi:hypothetical protein
VRYSTAPSGTERLLTSSYRTARYGISWKKWFGGAVPQNHVFLLFYHVKFIVTSFSSRFLITSSSQQLAYCRRVSDLINLVTIFGFKEQFHDFWYDLMNFLLYRSCNPQTAVCGAVPHSAVLALRYCTANPHTARCGIPHRVPCTAAISVAVLHRIPRTANFLHFNSDLWPAKPGASLILLDICAEMDGIRLLWSLLKHRDHAVQASAAWSICHCLEGLESSGELVRSFVGGLELLVTLVQSDNLDVSQHY